MALVRAGTHSSALRRAATVDSRRWPRQRSRQDWASPSSSASRKPRAASARALSSRTAGLRCLPPDQFSFPSGHTITAFAVAVSLSRFYPELATGLLFCALSIAASRILLGMHFPERRAGRRGDRDSGGLRIRLGDALGGLAGSCDRPPGLSTRQRRASRAGPARREICSQPFRFESCSPEGSAVLVSCGQSCRMIRMERGCRVRPLLFVNLTAAVSTLP